MSANEKLPAGWQRVVLLITLFLIAAAVLWHVWISLDLLVLLFAGWVLLVLLFAACATGWTRKNWPWILPSLLGLHLIAALVLSLGCACFLSVRNNAGWQPVLPAVEQHYIAEITTQNLRDLFTAQTVVNRWQIQGPPQLTKKDINTLSQSFELAVQLEADSTNLPPSQPSLTSQSTSTQKIKLLTNHYSIINETTSNQMVTRMTLNQVAAMVTTANTLSNSSATSIRPVKILPLEGDLRLIPARDLNETAKTLTNAIAALQRRATFVETSFLPSHLSLHPSRWFGKLPSILNSAPREVPRLTPLEKGQFQAKVDQSLGGSASSFGLGDLNVILLVCCFGVFGGAARSLASLGKFVAARKFLPSWSAYYLFHPIIGGAMGVAFLFVFRGGLMNATADPLSLFGTCAIAMVVGMFADEATQKLGKIAAGLFTDNTSKDPLEGINPTVQHVLVERPPLFQYNDIVGLAGLARKLQPPVQPPAQPQ